ncbi:odorant receptor 152 [Tribolium castaneum]|uniref:Odorant receptor n=1 Tax=Tribolium castaneum TaxID=7070 RepID=D2CG45_TRICA|nr:odorant receptor 152 [Tribolium castaneum]
MEYLKYCQTYIKGSGLAPDSPPIRKFLAKFFILPCFLIIALSIYKLRDSNSDIFLVIDVLECVASYTQLTIRKYIIYNHGKLMEEIISDCENLWSFDMFGPELGKNFDQKMRNTWTVVKSLITCGFVTFILMCVSATTSKENPLPFTCWVPNFAFATELLFLLQFLLLMELLYDVMAMDGFFLLVCMDIQIQFKMMKKMLHSIQFGVTSEEESWDKLVELVKQHNKMLKLHQKLNRVFSRYFLVQYAMTVGSMTVQAYTLKYSEANIETTIKSIVYTISLMLQGASFFFSASNIEIEAGNFSKEIYFLNWEDQQDVKIKKHILFMLMKSQENLELTGEGMVHVNRRDYLKMFRLAFTIATLLDGLSHF